MRTWTYPSVTVLEVVDGDTVKADLDLGVAVWLRGQLLRLDGCNAREMHQPGGPEAKAHLATMLTPGQVVAIEVMSFDKFAGRLDAKITLPDGTDLVTVLLAGQWLAAWDGNGPKPVPPWPRTV